MHHLPIRLQPHDADRYARLRRRMLDAAPWAFSATPATDRVLLHTSQVLADPRNAVVGVAAGAVGSAAPARELIAAGGLRRGASPDLEQRAMVWGMYVESTHRGLGLGKLVLCELLAIARLWSGLEWVDLSVTRQSVAALALYDSLGFERFDGAFDETKAGGACHEQLHLTLKL